MKTNKRILLVEDDSNFGRILKEYLSINNYNVDLASNGIEGYEKFTRSEYDLCILDVMMPYKDGFTLAKEIREKNDQIPIIFLTANSTIFPLCGRMPNIFAGITRVLLKTIRGGTIRCRLKLEKIS